MAAYDPLSLEILDWAKRAAIADDRGDITPRDLACGVYALAREGKLDAHFEPAFGASASSAAWDASVEAAYARAIGIPPDRAASQRLPFNSAVQAVVERAYSKSQTLAVAQLLAELALAGREFVLIDSAKGKVAGAAIGKAPALLRVLERVDRLATQLNKDVLGQEAAVSMLGQAYFQACVASRKAGPRGIFTFLGPSGVGKTLLAERFAQALAGFEGEAHAFRRFDMGSFGAPQNFEQLFGAESYYRGSKPGTLTGFVAEHPKAVILFDEIEKAHETTQQALLAVLDKGEVTDKALERPVSFAGTWLIFTTNLGREFFNAENASGVLRSGNVSSSYLITGGALLWRRL